MPDAPSNKPTSTPKTFGESFFLKKYSQVVYAIILIALIPLTILFNSIFIVRKFEADTNRQLRRQALIIAELFDTTAFDSLSDLPNVQEKLTKLLTAAQELRSFDVYTADGSEFRIAASSLPKNVGMTTVEPRAVLSWTGDTGYAELTEATQRDTVQNPELLDQRYWNVFFPLHDANGEKIALLNLKMNLAYSDALFKKSLLQSWVLLIVTLAIVLALLLLNTKLLEFAISFRKLEEVNKMKDEFISMASHELRTPITAIRGYISMFIEGSFGTVSDAGQKGLNIIQSSIRRLADLVEDLLDVSRIEQRRLQLNAESVNLNEVISQTVDELIINAKAKKLELAFAPSAIPLVIADRNKLRQVLVNLVGNAIKYTKQGSVTISAYAQGTKAVVKIKDTGIGIAAKDRDKLFAKFYRVSSEATKGIVGTGLGLWITRQLVLLMGGEISVDSMENVGTEVTFTLPLEKPGTEQAQSGAVAR